MEKKLYEFKNFTIYPSPFALVRICTHSIKVATFTFHSSIIGETQIQYFCSQQSSICFGCDVLLFSLFSSTISNQSDECIPSCGLLCNRCINTTQCTQCHEQEGIQLTSDKSCICKNGYYFDSEKLICSRCPSLCIICFDNNTKSCIKCKNSTEVVYSNFTCSCKAGFYYDAITGNCVKCYPLCLHCRSSSYNDCIDCISNISVVLLNNTSCVCDDLYYYNSTSSKCARCINLCSMCSNYTHCNKCIESATMVDTKCYCKEGSYHSAVNNTCVPCLNALCKQCTSETSLNCISCRESKLIKMNTYGKCSCINGYYYNGSECTNCSSLCTNCDNISNCNICHHNSTHMHNNKCYCNNGHYLNESKNECDACANGCINCTSIMHCSVCIATMSLMDGLCIENRGILYWVVLIVILVVCFLALLLAYMYVRKRHARRNVANGDATSSSNI